MLGHAAARNPAPVLKKWPVARPVRIGPIALGNALGNGLAEMSGRGSIGGPRAASGGFPLYAANQVSTAMNDAGPDIDPRLLGGLDDVTVTAPRLGADDEVKVYYGDRLIQSFFGNTPTGRAVSGFGESASAWIDRNRAEYNQYYDSRLRDASSPMSTALARTGRALSNAPFDLGAGAVGLYTLATDRNVQARTLSAIGNAVMNPVDTASGALGAARSYLANTSLPQMAEDVTRIAAGAALTGGLGRLAQVTSRAAVSNVGSSDPGALRGIGSRGTRNTEVLTVAQEQQLYRHVGELGLNRDDFLISTHVSAYSDNWDKVFLGPNMYRATEGTGKVNSVFESMTPRAAVAHEAGHMISTRAGRAFEAGSLFDEVNASLTGRDLRGLNSMERYQLLRDAAERARLEGQNLREVLNQMQTKSNGR
jgi:hypothetical protein